MTRIIVSVEGAHPGGTLLLPAEQAHYVRDVLRVRVGEPLELCDGAGRLARGTIRQLDKRGVALSIADVVGPLPRPALEVALLQAVSKADKLETTLRMTTELGLTRFSPVQTARSVKVLSGEARSEARFRGIAEDAIRVSGRVFLPQLDRPMTLEARLAEPRAHLSLVLVGSAPRPLRAVLLGAIAAPPPSVELLIGPEGGLSDAELEAAERAGFQAVSLGAHTLRTETAGPAALALVCFLLTPEPSADRAASPSG